jgi:hypothetical protein
MARTKRLLMTTDDFRVQVANALGHGFVAMVYENALAHEMRKSELGVVELKVVGALSDVHFPQCRNNLRATGEALYLLINFGRAQSRNPPIHRRNLIARTIPFIPAYPASSALRIEKLPPQASNAPPFPIRNKKAEVTPSDVRAILDDPPIHIRPTIPAICGYKANEPFRFRPLRRA